MTRELRGAAGRREDVTRRRERRAGTRGPAGEPGPYAAVFISNTKKPQSEHLLPSPTRRQPLSCPPSQRCCPRPGSSAFTRGPQAAAGPESASSSLRPEVNEECPDFLRVDGDSGALLGRGPGAAWGGAEAVSPALRPGAPASPGHFPPPTTAAYSLLWLPGDALGDRAQSPAASVPLAALPLVPRLRGRDSRRWTPVPPG